MRAKDSPRCEDVLVTTDKNMNLPQSQAQTEGERMYLGFSQVPPWLISEFDPSLIRCGLVDPQ